MTVFKRKMTSFFMFYYSLRDNVFLASRGPKTSCGLVWSPLRVENREIRH